MSVPARCNKRVLRSRTWSMSEIYHSRQIVLTLFKKTKVQMLTLLSRWSVNYTCMHGGQLNQEQKLACRKKQKYFFRFIFGFRRAISKRASYNSTCQGSQKLDHAEIFLFLSFIFVFEDPFLKEYNYLILVQ